MLGKAAIGVLLLCALLVCAFTAQTAVAEVAKNTTAVTCVKVAQAKTGDFEDSHCDKVNAKKEGEFGHVAIPINQTTKVVISNEKTKGATTTESTPTTFKGELAGAKLEGKCTVVTGEGSFTNEEPEPGVHTGKGSGKVKATSCVVEKPAKCTVKEPLEIPGVGNPVEGLGKEGKEMGGELKPETGKIFTSLTLEGSECSLKGKPLEVEGTAIVTGTPLPTEKHTGATAILTNAMTKETLKLGGKPVEVSGTTTVRMAPEGGKEGNLLSATTVT
jgi:hypothetical protein